MLFIEETSDTNRTVVDLSKQSLKKIPKNENVKDIRQLILDDNELQKFDNIDSYAKVEKVRLIFGPIFQSQRIFMKYFYRCQCVGIF